MDLTTILTICFTTFFAITTLLSIYTKSKQLVLHSRLRLQFTIGGILIFIGRGRRYAAPKPLGRKTSIAMVITTFVGMVLFYLVFMPDIVRFIQTFISYTTGAADVVPQPVVIPIPLMFKFMDLVPYLLVAIAVAVVVHEVMHALVALREGIGIKSWGIGLLLLIPIAFVELDDNDFNASSSKAKLNIISAGVFGNALISLFLLATLTSIGIVLPKVFGTPVQAVTISAIDCSICNTSLCPAKISGIEANTIVESVNGIRITSLDMLSAILSNISVGSRISLRTCSYNGFCKDFDIVLSAHRLDNPRLPCLGVKFSTAIVFEKDLKVYRIPWIENLMLLLSTMLTVNFSLFVLNSIPLFITDGTLFLRYLTNKYSLVSKLISMRIVDIINALIVILAIAFSSYLLLIR